MEVKFTTHYQLIRTIFLLMWGLGGGGGGRVGQQILFGLQDMSVSTENDATWWETIKPKYITQAKLEGSCSIKTPVI